jgi:hypothetical protein
LSNAELNAAISEAATALSFADLLAARGETTVVMGEDGEAVVRQPDGSVTPYVAGGTEGSVPDA